MITGAGRLRGIGRATAISLAKSGLITVEPVVVIPDILSKNESVKLISKSEKINGKDPKIAMVIHESAVKRKAWDKFSFLS